MPTITHIILLIYCPLNRTFNYVFSFSQAGHRGSSARLCLLVVIPPIPLNLVITRSHASDKLTLSAFSYNVKKRETPLCHHNEISLILIESVQLSFAFQPDLSAPQI